MRSFILSRLRGDAPLHTVFWRDMVIVGSGLNVLATATALVLLVAEAPSRWAVLVHLSPVPWNLFLFFSVWRSANQADDSAAGFIVKMCAAGWLVLMLLI